MTVGVFAEDGVLHLHEQRDGEERCICTMEPEDADAWIKLFYLSKQAALNQRDGDSSAAESGRAD